MLWSIDRLVIDRWSGVLCTEDEVQAPTMGDSLRAIAALNSKTHTMVFLFGSDNSYLCVGGGAGQYVAYVSVSGEKFLNLLQDGDGREGKVLINAGGQEGDFPARQVVDAPRVLRATRTFFETGALDLSLRWEEQV